MRSRWPARRGRTGASLRRRIADVPASGQTPEVISPRQYQVANQRASRGSFVSRQPNRQATCLRCLCFLLFAAVATAAEPPGLRSAIAAHFRAQAERSNHLYGAHIEPADASSYDFDYALTDLNGDGIPDAVVLLKGDYCGSGGCTLQIYRRTKRGYSFVSSSTISREPVRVLPERRFGWHSLTVLVGGGGKACDVLMRFNGHKYPLNPSLQPCATAAQLQAANTLTFDPTSK